MIKNIMIIGAGESGTSIVNELQQKHKDYKVCCLIDDDIHKHNTYIFGVPIVDGRKAILESIDKFSIDEIIIAMPSAPKQEIIKIIEICQKSELRIKILPSIYQLVDLDVALPKLRSVEIEDLLGRDVITIESDEIKLLVQNKTVLITGGGGSIGSELCRQIAANDVGKLIIFDIYENNAYQIQQELKRKYPELDLVVLIGSVRNTKKLDSVFEQYKPHIVFHSAAHKHVPLMEDSPNEAIKNNVFGTFKTAIAAEKYNVEKFVLISTDKAVNPTNIMGASKRICEMIIQILSKKSKTEFVAVRFGNVLGSNGSVIPLFKQQIATGGPITVTHPDIMRYFMTIPEAVSLVLEAGTRAKGGEIFVLDMGEPVKIVDLAKNLIKLSGLELGIDIDIVYTGLRPGEKLYEELLLNEEGLKTTQNSLIYIGKPLKINEKEFLQKLEQLRIAVENESSDTKGIVQSIVPGYKLQ